jgi:hypothetical protein
MGAVCESAELFSTHLQPNLETVTQFVRRTCFQILRSKYFTQYKPALSFFACVKDMPDNRASEVSINVASTHVYIYIYIYI